MERVSAERRNKRPTDREPAAKETQQRLRKLVAQLEALQGDVAGLSRQAEVTQGAVSELRLVEARHEIRAVQRRLDGLDAAVRQVESAWASMAEPIGGIATRTERVEHGVEEVGAGLGGLTSRVEAVERGMDRLSPRLERLDSDIAGIAEVVKELQEKLEELGSGASAMRSDVTGMAERSEASNASLGEAVEAASSQLRDVSSQTEAITSQVQKLQSRLRALNARLDGVDRTSKELAKSETAEAALARTLEVRREVRALRRGLSEVSELREEVAAVRRAIAALEQPRGQRAHALRRRLRAWSRPLRRAGRRIRRYWRLASRRTGRALRRARARIKRATRGLEQWLLAPRLGQLDHHSPRELRTPRRYSRAIELADPPVISIVTPSLNQGRFVGQTIQSVLDQRYPRLEYIVQDGGSTDETPKIIESYRRKLHHYEARPDNGQAHAINLGFRHATGQIMAYLNADDLVLPGTLGYVARYFERNPEVDVVYGHRILVDEDGREVGRWILPSHDDAALSWADFVPQETLYWRRRIWDGAEISLDEESRFALDWDLILRFRDAGARIVRLPRFLGAFRVHGDQKTSAQIASEGESEMARIRERLHGREVSREEIRRNLRGYMLRHVLLHKLYRARLLRY